MAMVVRANAMGGPNPAGPEMNISGMPVMATWTRPVIIPIGIHRQNARNSWP